MVVCLFVPFLETKRDETSRLMVVCSGVNSRASGDDARCSIPDVCPIPAPHNTAQELPRHTADALFVVRCPLAVVLSLAVRLAAAGGASGRARPASNTGIGPQAASASTTFPPPPLRDRDTIDSHAICMNAPYDDIRRHHSPAARPERLSMSLTLRTTTAVSGRRGQTSRFFFFA